MRLDVSERRIVALCHAGELETFTLDSGAILIAEDSVRRQMRWRGKDGRPYAPDMAFAALYLLSGNAVPWIGRQQRYRLNNYLRATDAENLTRLTRRRAQVAEYWCRDSMLDSVATIVRPSAATGALAESFHLVPLNVVEGYIRYGDWKDIVRKCRLRREATPIKVRLHVSEALPDGDGPMPIGVCAADLAESLNPRERRAGLETLDRLIAEFNDAERR